MPSVHLAAAVAAAITVQTCLARAIVGSALSDRRARAEALRDEQRYVTGRIEQLLAEWENGEEADRRLH